MMKPPALLQAMAKHFRLVFGLLPALLLAGCLHPLYGTGGDNGLVAQEMRAIEITPIPARLGHYLGDELIFALNGTGSHVLPKYKLTVTPAESVRTPLIDTVTGIATSSTVAVSAKYVLTSVDGGKPIAHGTVFVAASYDRTSQRFSDMRAARNAEQRDARTMADQIRTQLAAALASRVGS
ncbi:MAG TPA: LPS assembly lipoprotein LptE [Methylovirgula sp.]